MLRHGSGQEYALENNGKQINNLRMKKETSYEKSTIN